MNFLIKFFISQFNDCLMNCSFILNIYVSTCLINISVFYSVITLKKRNIKHIRIMITEAYFKTSRISQSLPRFRNYLCSIKSPLVCRQKVDHYLWCCLATVLTKHSGMLLLLSVHVQQLYHIFGSLYKILPKPQTVVGEVFQLQLVLPCLASTVSTMQQSFDAG